jgi:hypothetical protein
VSAGDERLKSMLHKIRSLLDKAASEGVTEPERELLNAKANELIARYGIDAAMLAAEDPKADQVSDRVITVGAPYAMDKVYLLFAIAAPLRIRMCAGKQPDGTRFVHLFGYGADLERVEILYTSLLLQAVRGLQHARPMPGESVKAFRRTWLAGFADAVGQRLRKAEDGAAATTTPNATGQSVALVLADRSALVAQAFRARYPQTRKTRRRLRGSGLASGHGAGMKANLGTNGSDLASQAGRRQLG